MRFLFCYEALKFDRKCRYLIISPVGSMNDTNMNDNDQTMNLQRKLHIFNSRDTELKNNPISQIKNSL